MWTYTLALLVGRDLAVVDSAGSTSNIALTSLNLSSIHTYIQCRRDLKTYLFLGHEVIAH